MHTLPFLQERIHQAISDLEFPRYPDELYEPIRYSMSIGGKRIRPLLVLLANDLYGGHLENALAPALALEIFHNFTLVHDDIMDNAPLRRGQVTVYRKWDSNIAILSGDTMFAIAYDYVAKTDPIHLVEVLKIFNQTAREVCEGQQLDMNFEQNSSVSLQEYLQMIRLKTAVLLGCCLKVGGIVGGACIHDTNYLYELGENLGLAFQIQDDLLDTFGNEETFGKKTGGDITSNKKTWLYIKALEIANEVQKEKLLNLFSNNTLDEELKILSVKGIFSDLRLEEFAYKEINFYYNKALEYLRKLSLPESKTAVLKAFCDKVMNRTY